MRSTGAQLSAKGSDDSGVTLLELVIAAAILLIATVSVTGALTFAGTRRRRPTSARVHSTSRTAR